MILLHTTRTLHFKTGGIVSFFPVPFIRWEGSLRRERWVAGSAGRSGRRRLRLFEAPLASDLSRTLIDGVLGTPVPLRVGRDGALGMLIRQREDKGLCQQRLQTRTIVGGHTS